MRIVKHLVRTDVRHFALLIGAWACVCIASAVARGIAPMLTADIHSEFVGVLGPVVLLVAKVLVTLIVVPMIMQADPAVGTHAFWMTRPIAPRTLVTAKLALLAATVVGIPVICEIALMAANHMGPGAIARGALQTAVVYAFWLSILAAVAALTPDIGRFSLVCIVWLIAGFGIAAFVSFARQLLLRSIVWRAFAPDVVAGRGIYPVDYTGTVILACSLIGIGIAVTLRQYRTRNVFRSAPLGVGGAVLALAIAMLWPWPVLRASLSSPEWATDPNVVKLVLDQPRAITQRFAVVGPPLDGSTHFHDWALAPLHVENVPDQWYVDLTLHDASLTLPGGQTLRSGRGVKGGSIPIGRRAEPPMRVVLQRALDVDRLASFAGFHDSSPMVSALESELAPYVNRTVAYHGEFDLDVSEVQTLARVPLRESAVFQPSANYRMTITATAAGANSIDLRARLAELRTVFDRTREGSYSYFLRNAARREAIAGNIRDASVNPWSTPPFWPFWVKGSGFNATDVAIYFPMAGFDSYIEVRPGPGIQVDRTWLDAAELVVLETTFRGTIRRTLDVPALELRSK